MITVTGSDRPGIVELISEVVLDFDGNVETSRMMRLGGEFAVLMLVSVEQERLDGLRDAVRALREEGFKVATIITMGRDGGVYSEYTAYEITVTGGDHEGIVHSVARYLGEQGINVETMGTSLTRAPMSGASVFGMYAVVLAPPEITDDTITDGLEEIGGELGVDVAVARWSNQPAGDQEYDV